MIVQLVANGLLAGCSYVLLSTGFAMAKRETGFFDFSYALQFTLAAYWTYMMFMRGLWLPAAAAAACIAAGVIGAMSQLLVYSPLARAGMNRLGLLITSLAVYGAGQNLVSLTWGDARLPLRTTSIVGAMALGPVLASRAQLVGLATSLAGLAAVAVLVVYTKFGRVFRAVADDHELASLCEIPVARYRIYAQALAGVLAGVAGVVFALDTGIEPRMGFRALLVAVVAVIVGGGGNVLGTAAAAIFLGLAQHLSVLVVASQWQEVVALLVLVIALIVRPGVLVLRHG